MADEEVEFGNEEGSSTNEQSSLLSKETSSVGKVVSSPIPGFPPFFQFAKLQTEASGWNADVTMATGFTRCNDAITDTASSVDNTGVTDDNAVDSSQSGSAAAKSIPVDGLDVIENMEKCENVLEQEDGEGNHEGPDKEEEEGAINDEPDEEEAESDPYFYTKRDEFTSEIYKIELQNLPKKCGYKVSDFPISHLSRSVTHANYIKLLTEA